MTTELVKRLTELEAKATPGPWTKAPDFPWVLDCNGYETGGRLLFQFAEKWGWRQGDPTPNLEFMAALRNAWPQIKAALESSHKQGWIPENIRDHARALRVLPLTMDSYYKTAGIVADWIIEQSLPSPAVKEK